MNTQFDIPELSTVYLRSKNYKVVNGNCDAPDRCFVFFSGNGIYFPNSENEFHRTIVVGDRYEWGRLSPQKSEYRKAIYVRDVRKTWYIDGISGQLNSVESVHNMLKEETRDFSEIVCVGNSAGGYAAVLFGTLLRADKIFSISGFFEIASQVNEPTNLALQFANAVPEKSKWFDLSDLIRNTSCAIYFLFPANSELDKLQAHVVKNFPSVRTFPFNHAAHGVCAQNFVYPFLFVKSKAELDCLSHRVTNRSWGAIEFSVATIGLRKALICYLGYLGNRAMRLLLRSAGSLRLA